MYRDGVCHIGGKKYSKCVQFEDINYQLAQPDEKSAIFSTTLTLPFRYSYLSSIKAQRATKPKKRLRLPPKVTTLTAYAQSTRKC